MIWMIFAAIYNFIKSGQTSPISGYRWCSRRPVHIKGAPSKRRVQCSARVSRRGCARGAAAAGRQAGSWRQGVHVLLRAEGQAAHYWQGMFVQVVGLCTVL